MLTRLLRRFGFYKIRWGVQYGRHWVEINGKIMAQTEGNDLWIRDEDVQKIQKLIEGTNEQRDLQ